MSKSRRHPCGFALDKLCRPSRGHFGIANGGARHPPRQPPGRRHHPPEGTDHYLLQGFHELGHRHGVVGRQAGQCFLMRGLVGVVALSEQIGDFVRTQAGALQRRTDFALTLRAMATCAFGLVGGGSICSKPGMSERCGQRDDESSMSVLVEVMRSPSVF
jgi:hypothetical protein